MKKYSNNQIISNLENAHMIANSYGSLMMIKEINADQTKNSNVSSNNLNYTINRQVMLEKIKENRRNRLGINESNPMRRSLNTVDLKEDMRITNIEDVRQSH